MGKIVLLTGKTKAGKDEAARILKKMGYNFERLAFADKLKAAVAHAKGITVEEMEANKETHRPDLILAGKVGRYVDPLIWIKTVDWSKAKQTDVVVTDVRFKNEWDFIEDLAKKNNLKVIKARIKAADGTRVQRGANPAVFDDESETGLDDIHDSEFDFIINNHYQDFGNLEMYLFHLLNKLKN